MEKWEPEIVRIALPHDEPRPSQLDLTMAWLDKGEFKPTGKYVTAIFPEFARLGDAPMVCYASDNLDELDVIANQHNALHALLRS